MTDAASQKLVSPARENFAQHYALYGKVGAAARRAGIHPNTASKWLQDADIKERVEWLQEKAWEEEAQARRQVGVVFVLSEYYDLIQSTEDESIKARLLRDLLQMNGLLSEREESGGQAPGVKVFLMPGAEPGKIGLQAVETEPAPPPKPRESEEARAEEDGPRKVIPLVRTPTKTIVLPERGPS